MPPKPFGLGLKIVTEPEAQPANLAIKIVQDDMESWEMEKDGHVAMLGKSLRGQYVFGEQGLIKAAGQDAPHYRVTDKDIMLIKQLGAGACGTVHKGYHMVLRKFVAVKRVNCANKELRQQMLRDIKILIDAHEVPGLLSFLGAYLVPKKDQMAIVLEYMDGGTLLDVLQKLGRVPEDVMAQITSKLLQGLAFMHAKHMVHRDIKPANILMNLSGEAKLSDFGISATVDHTLAQCMTYAGTVTYMSPERLENKPYNYTADIWSLGLCLVECLTGKYPFDAAGGPMDLIIHVLQDEVPLPPPGTVSELCRDFLAACLLRDPSKRPPATMLLGHPWVAQAAAVNLKGLLRNTMFSPDDKLDEIAFHFSFTYYSLLSGGQGSRGLEQLAPLYLDHSIVTYQGQVLQGRAAILAKLQEAANSSPTGVCGPVIYKVTSVDSQFLLETGCVVVHVMGNLQPKTAGSAAAPATPVFGESFILGRTPGGEYYVANQVFRTLR